MFKLFKNKPVTEQPKTNFKMFERVTHTEYGDGVINAIYPDKSCWVAFERKVAKVPADSLEKWRDLTLTIHTNFPNPC